jgi:hypothetical protein
MRISKKYFIALNFPKRNVLIGQHPVSEKLSVVTEELGKIQRELGFMGMERTDFISSYTKAMSSS